MKKRAYLSLILTALLLTGCQPNPNNSSSHAETEQSKQESVLDSVDDEIADDAKVSADLLIGQAQAEMADLQTASPYANLDFTNTQMHLPERIGSLCALQISEGNVSQAQLTDLFLDTVASVFRRENVEQKELYFYDSGGGGYMTSDGLVIYPQLYQDDHEEKLRNGSMPLSMYLFQTDTYEVHESDEYLLMFDNLQLVKMNLGNCMRSVEKTRRTAGWMPKDDFNVEQTLSPDSAESYALLDGEVALNQAVQFCEDYFISSAPYREAITTPPIVHSVELLAVDDTHYGYLMLLSRSYAGIPFDSIHFEGMVSNFSDGNEYLFDNSELLMVKSDEVEYCYISYLANTVTPVGDLLSEVISLETAAAAVSEMMTDHVAFDVKQISIVYSNQKSEEEGVISNARPAWRFALYNPNDACNYIVLVDVEDQSSYYYRY